MNLFPDLIAPFPLILLLNLCNKYKVALVVKLDKKSLAKGTARSHSAFLPNVPIILSNVLPRHLTH